MKYIVNTLLVWSLLLTTAHAQETWSLERCIRYAQENNITVQQAAANVKIAVLAERQAKAARLPNVSANANLGKQFGRTIDPTTNQFSTTSTGYNSLGLNAGISLFNGGLIHHQVKQAGWELEAANADAAQTVNNLGLQVAQAYLSILLANEQLENARRRVAQSQQQLDVTLKLINAGSTPMAEKYNLIAQIARDEQSAVSAQNSLELGYLNLKQLMQLEPDFELQIEQPAIVVPTTPAEAGTLTDLYKVAATTQPIVKAAEFRIKGAEEGIPIARSAYYPTISAFANLSSNYSSQFVTVTPYGEPFPGEEQTIYIDGQAVKFSSSQRNYTVNKVPYFDQLDQNFGQGVGLSISVPIYQNGRTRLSVERAHLGVLNAQIQNTQVRQQLKNDIQTALANARAARQQLDASQKTYDATNTAFQNMGKRLNLGAVNTFDLTTAKSNLDIAENDLVVAKYTYLFNLKILDFYQGRQLSLNN
ncbi:MAG: TolC family protein [Saprospiraceae bacterium]